MALNPFNMPMIASLAQPTAVGTEMPQYDPISLQGMLANLPKVQQQKRRVAALRKVQESIGELEVPRTKGGYAPTVHGGLYETVPVYEGPSAGKAFMESLLGSAAKGFAGGVAGSFADKAEQGLEQETNKGILSTVQQLADTRKGKGPVGGPAEGTLRAYMGMLGGPDIKAFLPQDSSTRKVHKVEKNKATGKATLIYSNGDTEDTDIDYEYAKKYVHEEGELPALVDLGGKNAGQTSPVGPNVGGTPPEPGAGGVAVNLDGLTPEQNAALGPLIASMPVEQQEQFIKMIESRPRTVGGPNAPATTGITVPPASNVSGVGGPARPVIGPKKTDAQKAAEKVVAEAQAGAQVADIVANTAAAKEYATGEAQANVEYAAAARESLPKAQALGRQVRATITPMLAEGSQLDNVVGSIPSAFGSLPGGKAMTDAYFGGFQVGTPQADFYANHENLTSQAFLRGYADSLKGTGQVSNIEGLKAAQANLQAALYQSPQQYRRRLEEFMQEVDLIEQRLQQAMVAPPRINPRGTPAPAVVPGQSSNQQPISDEWDVQEI